MLWNLRSVAMAVSVLALALIASPSAAHPGGTDRFGCHVESATGVRHCHNEGASEMNVIGGVEGGLEVGRAWWHEGAEKVGYHGAAYVQQDGTVALLLGFSAYYHHFEGGGGTYIDLGLGPIWVPESDAALTFRIGAGFKVRVVSFGTPHRFGYLKIGGFVEMINDGVNAEPAGAHLAFGVNL